MLKIKRAYEAAQSDDGYRILIDRLWPRGISKEKAAIDLWAKDIAPQTKTRKAFHHEPEKFPAFKKQYISELNKNPSTESFAGTVEEKLKEGDVTLVYAAKDAQYSDVAVLEEYLEKKLTAKAGKEK